MAVVPNWYCHQAGVPHSVPLEKLQTKAAPGMAPDYVLKLLDMQHGERGRLVYDGESCWWSFGLCVRNSEPEKLIWEVPDTK